MAKALGISYVLLVAGVMASALYLWHLRCEGFGCTGIGIAWLGWAAAVYLPVGLAGLFARNRAALGAGLSKAVRLAAWAHGALGAGLLIYFVARPAQ